MTENQANVTPAATVTVQRHEHKSLDYQDSIEMPSGGTKDRSPGWKVYVDMMDLEGTKRRIEAAKLAAVYAMEYQPPVEPKVE